MASNQIHIDGPPVNSDCLGEGGMFVGGGDGGGASLVRAPGATSVRAAEVSGSGTNETSVLNGAVPGAEQQDAFRVTWAASSEGTLATRLREQANEQAWLDAVRLFVVDYSAGLVPYRLGGSFVLGTRQAAAHVTAGNGSDITRSLDSAGAYVAVPGETLRVELGQGAGVLPLLVGTSGQGAVEILVADTLGVCQTHAMLHPRRAFDEVALPAPAADDVRVVCTGSVTVGFLGHLGVSDTQATVHLAELISAEGTRHANVLQAIASVDSLSVTLSGPDTLQLSFSLPEAPAGARDLFLVVDAILGGTQGTRGASMKPTRAEVDPIRFALEQSRPNPSAGKTTIRFALPSTTTVHLEVFDLMGRHVRTLAFGPFLPGYHSIEWDHRDVSGNFVRPGVYLYRLIAGQYRDQKKMVLLAR